MDRARPAADETSIEALLQSIIHQTTVLIAQLATTRGARAPLERITDRFFVDLALELKRRGVSTKVSADMFGLSLRTYQRQVTRARNRLPRRGASLRQAIRELVYAEGRITRAEILRRFPSHPRQVRAVLRDLEKSRLVIASGRGEEAFFQGPLANEPAAAKESVWDEGMDGLLVALIHRRGPLGAAEVASLLGREPTQVASALIRLSAAGHVEALEAAGAPVYRATALELPLETSVGWETAVKAHFSALVSTVVARLARSGPPASRDRIGGSTFVMDLWQGHPLADEVHATLSRFRATLADLRGRVAKAGGNDDAQAQRSRTLIYVGQCLSDATEPEPDEPA